MIDSWAASCDTPPVLFLETFSETVKFQFRTSNRFRTMIITKEHFLSCKTKSQILRFQTKPKRWDHGALDESILEALYRVLFHLYLLFGALSIERNLKMNSQISSRVMFGAPKPGMFFQTKAAEVLILKRYYVIYHVTLSE